MAGNGEKIKGKEVMEMPFGDGTGPLGLGPMTGRAAGFCAGFGRPGFVTQCLVTITRMVTLMQRRCGPGGVGALVAVGVVAWAVVGGDGNLMGTLGGKF